MRTAVTVLRTRATFAKLLPAKAGANASACATRKLGICFHTEVLGKPGHIRGLLPLNTDELVRSERHCEPSQVPWGVLDITE